MLIDSHCHLASHKFPTNEIPQIISRAKEAEVSRLITLATNITDIPSNLAIAEEYSEVFACVGIHPCDVLETQDDFAKSIKKYATHPRCVAIGETGLDYYHPAPDGTLEADYHNRQKDFLNQHFKIAAELEKNIVIHTRDRSGQASLNDAIDIYQQWASKVRAVFHCFPFDFETARRILDLGGIISFTGIATFKNATTVLETAKQCPAGTWMVETDSPYLAPVPHRGKRNEPAFVRATAEALAHARGETFAELALHTSKTAENFYHLPSQT